MTMKPNQSQWYLNCNRTWSSLKSNTTINSSLINSTITTPFWNFETTTSAGNLSTIIDIEVMVSAIFGMVIVIVLYATAYKLLDCKGSSYHDSYREGAEHAALTLFTYAFYLFDTLSDVLLFLQYVAIGQVSNFLLSAATTIAPVLFLELMVVTNWHYRWPCGSTSIQKIVSKIVVLVLVLMCIPLAALIPTLTYAQVLAIGKDDSGRKQHDYWRTEKKNETDIELHARERVCLKPPVEIADKSNKPDEIGNANDLDIKPKKYDGKEFSFQYFATYLTLVEATLESAPQLILQIYLSITDTYTDTNSTRVIRYLSIVGSSIVLAWSLTAFSHQIRKTNENREDKLPVKFIHWISRIFEFVPRVILIALISAEYSVYVMLFIVYRLLFAIIYTTCEIRAEKNRYITDWHDILLGIIGNIFCFSVSHVYKLQKKEHFGGKFLVGYYILFYAENGGLLYLWYIDDPVLLQIKNGGACSNHEWFLPYVFVIVILGFICQPSFLFLYYRLRDKKCEQRSSSSNAGSEAVSSSTLPEPTESDKC